MDKNVSFSEVVSSFSSGGLAIKGGDLGFIEVDVLKEELKKALDGVSIGGVSDIVETKEGFFILKLEARQEAVTRSYEEVKENIGMLLLQTKEKEEIDKLIEQTKEDLFVEVYGL